MTFFFAIIFSNWVCVIVRYCVGQCQVGLQWMLSWYNNKLNGILADEMGLGKTVQVVYLCSIQKDMGGCSELISYPRVSLASSCTSWYLLLNTLLSSTSSYQVMALIAHLMKFKGNYGPHLIIVPNAVLVNWKRMKDRESVLARDLDRYRCQRRQLLTGTPLQNDLKELWSLLNLLLPEVFDNRKAFHDWFSKPFQKEGPTHEAEDDWLETEKKVIIIHRLHQILEPFMLRRRVEDVEGSLPAKDSIVLRCRMSAFQSAIYDWIKSTGTIRVDPEDEKVRVQKSSIYQAKKREVKVIYMEEALVNKIPSHQKEDEFGSGGSVDLEDDLAGSENEPRRGRPKANKSPNYKEIDDNNGEYSDEGNRYSAHAHDEEREIREFVDDESSGAGEAQAIHKDQSEDEFPACDGGLLMPDEGEIAMSGDSHMDRQQSGSWIHERDEGEDEQGAMQLYGFSHEVRSEARKVHDLFFDLLKIAFPNTDFREARGSLSFSGPAPPTSNAVPSQRRTVASQSKIKDKQTNEADTDAHKPIPQRESSKLGEDARMCVQIPLRETRQQGNGSTGNREQQQDDSPLHPGELVMCKKKRKDREKPRAGSSGPVSVPS
ncbi:unnamed protein product [Linum tenue]|uniref:Helicase ATP-binding domain-containing protein n=1 Tax=Linum tenue TaxID=586396 RepID=A0AAV0KVJ5_9ROSI|nr:unnamed protein product [Linum tenue]